MTGNGFAGRKGLHAAGPESHGAAFAEAGWPEWHTSRLRDMHGRDHTETVEKPPPAPTRPSALLNDSTSYGKLRRANRLTCPERREEAARFFNTLL